MADLFVFSLMIIFEPITDSVGKVKFGDWIDPPVIVTNSLLNL